MVRVFHVNLPIVIVTAYRQVVVPDGGASPREESRLSGYVSLFSTDQRPLRVPKHEWNASCDGRCTRETTALEWNGPVDSPAQGRTIIARALRRATRRLPMAIHFLSAPFFRARISGMKARNAVACRTNNARASNSSSGRWLDRARFSDKPFQGTSVVRVFFFFCALFLLSYFAATVRSIPEKFLVLDPWQAFSSATEDTYPGTGVFLNRYLERTRSGEGDATFF